MRTAILGASGLVGRTMLDLLARQDWLDEPPLLLTSDRSAGLRLPWRGRDVPCRAVAAGAFDGVAVALFSAGGAASRVWAPQAMRARTMVVDNSSAWREDPAVPLVVPEVNGALVPRAGSGRGAGGLVANPNCSTIQIALPCAALDRAAGLREVHVTTMQAVSGAGQQGVAELAAQAPALAVGPAAGAERGGAVFARRIAANVVPQIGALGDDGAFAEEGKVVRELRRILAGPDLAVTCTAVRAPVWNGHAAAVRVVLAGPLDREAALAALAAFPGVRCQEDPGAYRTPAEISGDVLVHVGRLRHEQGRGDALLFWVVADNLLKGAAWNAVQIMALHCGVEARP